MLGRRTKPSLTSGSATSVGGTPVPEPGELGGEAPDLGSAPVAGIAPNRRPAVPPVAARGVVASIRLPTTFPDAARPDMAATTVSQDAAPAGPDGQKLLAAGARVGLRLWDEGPTEGKGPHANDYETVGLVLEGEATLTIDGAEVALTPGLSWLVPSGAEHFYTVPQRFKAVEATSPPAR